VTCKNFSGIPSLIKSNRPFHWKKLVALSSITLANLLPSVYSDLLTVTLFSLLRSYNDRFGGCRRNQVTKKLALRLGRRRIYQIFLPQLRFLADQPDFRLSATELKKTTVEFTQSVTWLLLHCHLLCFSVALNIIFRLSWPWFE